MSDWNGTIRITWRLGVLAAITGTVVGGAFWAGRFTSRVDDMTVALETLTVYSRGMGVKVGRLREQQVADVVGDKSVERRLARIEGVLVRIEDLIRVKYRRGNVD
jgi:hypothetical protein